MGAPSTLVADLAVVTGVAAVTGLIARKLGQPSILGYLFAGLIVGPYLPIPLFADPERIHSLAELGVVLVLFAVGLEFRVKRLLAILPVSGLTAVTQITMLAWVGAMVGTLFGWNLSASLTLGCAVAISSTMVVSGVLRAQPVADDLRSYIFGILVVQDVVAIVLMAVVTTLAAGQSLDLWSLALLVFQLGLLVVTLMLVGLGIIPRLLQAAADDAESLAVLAVGTGFAFAGLASLFGFSPALGAFVAGMVVSESGRGKDVEHAIEPIRALFAALFFVSIGMTVDPVMAYRSLPLALTLTVGVVAAQLVSVTLGSVLSGSSLRKGILSGLALGQIGELSFILATIATAGGLVPAETLPALVTVATLTAFTTPLALANGERLVRIVDRLVPDRVHHILAAYQETIGGDGTESALRGPTRNLVLYAGILLIVTLVRGPMHDAFQTVAVDLGAVVVAAPLLFGLFVNGRQWTAALGQRARRQERSMNVVHALDALARVALVVWIGIPLLALATPLMGATLPQITLAIALAVVVVWLVRTLTGFSEAYGEQIARLVIPPAPGGAPAHAEPDSYDPLPIEHVLVQIAADAQAVGATLTELDLRSRTGASVIAIRHDADTVVLPTGHERLKVDDQLALAGAPAAIERAVALLTARSVPTS